MFISHYVRKTGCNKDFFLSKKIMANSRTFGFTAAVRSFLVFQKTWKPVLKELLDCFHEQGNDFDYFSIKTCKKDDSKKVGHPPREISRPTKFLIDRGARVTAQITSSHYKSLLSCKAGWKYDVKSPLLCQVQ